MRGLVLLIAALLIGFVSFGQRTVAADTLNGNETVAFGAMQGAKAVSVLCTNVGGTSDGSIYLQGSVDGSNYETLQFDVNDGFIYSNTDNDSLTITDGAIWILDLSKINLPYYRIEGAGTDSDSTLINITWSK